MSRAVLLLSFLVACAGKKAPVNAPVDASPASDAPIGEPLPATVAERAAELAGAWRISATYFEPLPDLWGTPTLEVHPDGRVSGFAGVNRFDGALGAGDALFGPFATTRKAGSPEAMSFEKAYLERLGTVDGYAIAGDRLTLAAGGAPQFDLKRHADKPVAPATTATEEARGSNQDPGSPRFARAVQYHAVEVIERAPLQYPPEAVEQGLGVVVCKVRVHIDKAGVPTQIEPTDCPSGFQSAARDSLAQWRWQPAQVNGDAVEAQFGMVLHFSPGP